MIHAGKVFLAAKAKSGKTTMCLYLLKSLVDGVDFLGRFKVTAPEGRIGYMNLELTEGQMQEWLRQLNISKVDRIHIWNLRGKPNPFRSEISRDYLIREIQELGVQTLIIDTFAKVFSSNANDNSEVTRFLVMLDEVLDRAGIRQLVMLVHAGNDAMKTRGATALTDHPDAIWYLYTDENRNRFFNAIGRDVDVPEGQIVLDSISHELLYTGAGKKAARDLGIREKCLSIIKLNPGQNASFIDELLPGTKAGKISVRKRLIADKLVEVRKGPNNSDLYYPVVLA